MIRLFLSTLIFAFFVAPVLAQTDDLPPLPTRAEVLAEIEAEFESYIASLDAEDWYGGAVWDFFRFDVTQSIGGNIDREIWLPLLDRAARELEADALNEGAAFQPFLSAALFYSRLGADEGARRMLELAQAQLDAGIGNSAEQISHDRDRLYWMAHTLGYSDLAADFARDILTGSAFLDAEPSWAADTAITMAVELFAMDEERLADEFLTLYRETYQESAGPKSEAIHATFSAWLSRHQASVNVLPLLELDSEDRVSVARFLGRMADQLGQPDIALRYFHDAFQTELEFHEPRSIYSESIGAFTIDFAVIEKCDSALAAMRLSFAWGYIFESEFQREYPEGTVFNYPLIYTPDGSTVIHSREYLGWAGGTLGSRRILAAVKCDFVELLIRDLQSRNALYIDPSLISISDFIHAEGFMNPEEIRQIRIAFYQSVEMPFQQIGFDLTLSELLAERRETGTVDATFPLPSHPDGYDPEPTVLDRPESWIAQAAYWSAGARLAGQDEDADEALDFAWRLVNEAEGVNRIAALASLAIAIAE
jgi:hypothetical protein